MSAGLQSTNSELPQMDSCGNLDENCELAYQASPSSVDQTDQSTPGTTRFSMLSRDSFAYCRTNSETSAFSEPTDGSSFGDDPSPLLWPVTHHPAVLSRLGMKQRKFMEEETPRKPEKPEGFPEAGLEMEMMKERFSKLLLGEDMSGSGKGVCTAVAISNSITNLYATVFGQNLRLEPLNHEKKLMWKREMECLLSVCDYIVEFFPVSRSLTDGTVIEVMSSRPRSDIHINLPALQKLDSMLLEILDSFEEAEFWYVEQGKLPRGSIRMGSFRGAGAHRKEEKWWLPVPCVPRGGLSEKWRKHLQHKRDCANQIHKAAMAINSAILAELEIPDTYIASLPKSGRASLGDSIYRYMCTADEFSPDYLLNCLKIASEHEALELADRVEASMYTWRRKACLSHSKSSWGMVKDLVNDTDRNDKNHALAERADKLLFCLKQRYPELSQTTLDTCKIEHNRDVGQAVLESYSRVLEGLAFNLVAWIEDVLYVDGPMKPQV